MCREFVSLTFPAYTYENTYKTTATNSTNRAVGCMFSINMMNARQMNEKQDIRFSLKEQKEFGIIH